MSSERLTSQKQIILNYLSNVKTHPSADKVYLDVKKKLPSISKGTVYRILNNFVARGVILEINGEIKRFDGDISNHDHYVCKKCNQIYDIFNRKYTACKKIKNIGTVLNQQTYFYGICEKCQK
ncbi:MAG: transcriptional repressor [Patescibacteria group bacterium]